MLSKQDEFDIVYILTSIIPKAVWEIETTQETYEEIKKIMAFEGYEIVKKEPTDAKE